MEILLLLAALEAIVQNSPADYSDGLLAWGRRGVREEIRR